MQPLLDELLQTERGREIHDAFGQLSREIAYLVRAHRPVTVAWHRNEGPSFLACAINHLKGHARSVPRQIGSVTRAEFLARMSAVLYQHGSNPLRVAIDRHRAELRLLADAETAQECIEILRHAEAEVPA